MFPMRDKVPGSTDGKEILDAGRGREMQLACETGRVNAPGNVTGLVHSMKDQLEVNEPKFKMILVSVAGWFPITTLKKYVMDYGLGKK